MELLVMGAKQRQTALFALNLIQTVALRLIAHHPLRHRKTLIAILKPFVEEGRLVLLKRPIQIHHATLHVLINRDDPPSCHKEVPVRQI